MASMVPLYAFNEVKVPLPYLQRLFWRVNAPEVNFRLTCSGELRVVLPSNIKNSAGLLKMVKRFLLNVRGVPHQYIGLIATTGYQSVRLVPAGADKMALGSEQALDFTLNVPDTRYVVVRAGEQEVARVAPLYGLYEVILVGPLRYLIITLRYAYVAQLYQWFCLGYRRSWYDSIQSEGASACGATCRDGHALRTQEIVIPYVDEHVAGAASGQQPLMRIPLREEYLAVVFFDDPHALAVRDERYLVCQGVLSAILLHGTVQ